MRIIETLIEQAKEIADGGHDGWGNTMQDAAAKIALMEAEMKSMADQLDRWANESRQGGWSTHQVNPMRDRADSIRRMLAQ